MDIYWAEFESTFDSLIRGVSLNTKLMSSGWSKSPTVAMKHLGCAMVNGVHICLTFILFLILGSKKKKVVCVLCYLE